MGKRTVYNSMIVCTTDIFDAAYEGHYDKLHRILSFKNIEHSLEEIEAIKEFNQELVNTTDPFNQCTALHYAAMKGHVNVMRLLICHGADLNAPCKDGMTPIMYATMAGQVTAVQLLLYNGADVTVKDVKENTVLDIAKARQDVNILLRIKCHTQQVKAHSHRFYSPPKGKENNSADAVTTSVVKSSFELPTKGLTNSIA